MKSWSLIPPGPAYLLASSFFPVVLRIISFPVPLTDPPKDIAVELEVRPMPPKLNAGIDLVPSKKD